MPDHGITEFGSPFSPEENKRQFDRLSMAFMRIAASRDDCTLSAIARERLKAIDNIKTV